MDSDPDPKKNDLMDGNAMTGYDRFQEYEENDLVNRHCFPDYYQPSPKCNDKYSYRRKDMLKLTHHVNNRHNKLVYEIGSINIAEDGCYRFDFTDITGYGSTNQEALDDFKNKFNQKFQELMEFKKLLFGSKHVNALLPEVIEVGYSGEVARNDEAAIERKVLEGDC